MRISRKNLQRLVENYILNEVALADVGFKKGDIIKIKNASITKTFEIRKVDKTTGKANQNLPKKNKANSIGLSTSARYIVLKTFVKENSDEFAIAFIKKVNLNNLDLDSLDLEIYTKKDADYAFFGDAYEHFEKVELPTKDKKKTFVKSHGSNVKRGDKVTVKDVQNLPNKIQVSILPDAPKDGREYFSIDDFNTQAIYYRNINELPEDLMIEDAIFEVIDVINISGTTISDIVIGTEGRQESSDYPGRFSKAEFLVREYQDTPIFEKVGSKPKTTTTKNAEEDVTSGSDNKAAAIDQGQSGQTQQQTQASQASDQNATNPPSAPNQNVTQQNTSPPSSADNNNNQEANLTWEKYVSGTDKGKEVKDGWFSLVDKDLAGSGDKRLRSWLKWYRTQIEDETIMQGFGKQTTPVSTPMQNVRAHLSPTEVLTLYDRINELHGQNKPAIEVVREKSQLHGITIDASMSEEDAVKLAKAFNDKPAAQVDAAAKVVAQSKNREAARSFLTTLQKSNPKAFKNYKSRRQAKKMSKLTPEQAKDKKEIKNKIKVIDKVLGQKYTLSDDKTDNETLSNLRKLGYVGGSKKDKIYELELSNGERIAVNDDGNITNQQVDDKTPGPTIEFSNKLTKAMSNKPAEVKKHIETVRNILDSGGDSGSLKATNRYGYQGTRNNIYAFVLTNDKIVYFNTDGQKVENYGGELLQESLSRGALYRKRYYGRY